MEKHYACYSLYSLIIEDDDDLKRRRKFAMEVLKYIKKNKKTLPKQELRYHRILLASCIEAIQIYKEEREEERKKLKKK